MVPPILPERPEPSDASDSTPAAHAHAAAEIDTPLRELILAEVDRNGFLPFSRFMQLALYAPGLGYYAGGSTKFGSLGDFVTAPEISALFGRALANQVAQLIELGCDSVLELGAGSGRLAADLLVELARRGRTPARYLILEVSADLRDRQRATLERAIPQVMDRVCWLDRLPERFSGIVLGNEVLDAMPVELVTTRNGQILQRGVGRGPETRALTWRTRPASGELLTAARNLDLPDDYTTEIHLHACGLMRSLGAMLERGAALFLDYGFPRREYYHPQRRDGTLMCHFRHRAHSDPLALIGLQDITAHLDFTALAEAAVDGGLAVLGYANQAQFLINCGIADLLLAVDPADTANYAPACAAVQKLVSPAEMGELFKVIACGRGLVDPLLGFRAGDRRIAL